MLFHLGKAILLGRKEERKNQDMITYYSKHKNNKWNDANHQKRMALP